VEEKFAHKVDDNSTIRSLKKKVELEVQNDLRVDFFALIIPIFDLCKIHLPMLQDKKRLEFLACEEQQEPH